MKFKKILLLPLLLISLVSCGGGNKFPEISSSINSTSQEGSKSESTPQTTDSESTLQPSESESIPEASKSESTPSASSVPESAPEDSKSESTPDVSISESIPEDSTSESTPEGNPVFNEIANQIVARAIQQLTDETFESLELTATIDAFAQRKFDLKQNSLDGIYHKDLDEDDAIQAIGSATIKAKDLEAEYAQIAISGLADIKLFMKGIITDQVEAKAGLYYVDEFGYLDLDLKQFNIDLGQNSSNRQQQKIEMGRFPGLSKLINELFGMPTEDLPAQPTGDLIELSTFIAGFLNKIDTVEAKVGIDGVTTVKYVIKPADIIQILFKVLEEQMGEEADPNELQEIKNQIEMTINESLVIRKAIIEVKVGKNGFLKGLAIDIDADLIQEYEKYRADLDMNVEGIDTTKVRGTLSLDFKINEPVTITFPDFTDFVLVNSDLEEFPEIF